MAVGPNVHILCTPPPTHQHAWQWWAWVWWYLGQSRTPARMWQLWWYHQRGNLKPFRARRSQEGYLASMLHARASAVEQGTICGCTHSTYQPSAAPATWGLIQPNWSQSQPWLWSQAGHMCFTSFACTCLIQAAFLTLAWCSTVWKYCILSDSDKCHDPLA